MFCLSLKSHYKGSHIVMAPKLSLVQIDEKLERLHEFVCDHAGLLASRNGASLRACLRQTASAEEKRWYQFLCKNASVFSESQNDRVRRTYALLEEQWSSVAFSAAVLPEPAAGTFAVLPGPVAESAAAAPESPAQAAVLPELKAEAAAPLPKSTPDTAAALPESVTEAASVQTASDKPEFPVHKKARSIAPADMLAFLQTGPMLKAVDFLEALPAQSGVIQLRHVLHQWRAVGTLANKDEQRRQLRQVAADLGIPLPRGVCDDSTRVSRAIADGFTARVSALRTFVVSSAGAMPGRMAATAAVAAQVATRGSGAGEPAGGSEGLAEDSAPKGEHDSEWPDGGDSCADRASVGISMAVERVAVAGAGPVQETRGVKRGPLPRPGGSTKRQKTIRHGRADSSTHARPQGVLTWYMSPKIDDAHIPNARPLCLDDIVTIEDASLFARDHAPRIPVELLRRVWHVRGNLTQMQTKPLARRLAIRTQYKKNGRNQNESEEWVKYEVRRHVVAELEAHFCTDSPPTTASSNEGVGAVEPNGDAGTHAAARGEALWRLERTPRTIKDLVESLCEENSQFLVPFGEDLGNAPLETRLDGGECFRRLLCFRFEVEYTSLPLGARKLRAFTLEACQRERKMPEEPGGCTADDLAEDLQRASEAHVWLQLLLTRTGKVAVPVDWSERAEQFILFFQAAVLESPPLATALGQMRRGQLRVLALWWAYLNCRKATGIERPSLMTALALEKKKYVPVEAVAAPEKPYFATVPLFGLPNISAPRVCQLCGAGFRDWSALVGHCSREHGGFNEYRKRLFWEADRCHALGLPNARKRNMVANAATAIVYSRPGGEGDLEERRQEACVVCARKGWLESRFQCYLWKAFPRGDARELAAEKKATKDGVAEECLEPSDDEERRRPRRLLRDADGVYYMGDAAEVNKFLGVEHYAKAMPRIPLKELHASSVRHPKHSAYRWLLHTRRVQTQQEETGGVHENASPTQLAPAGVRGCDDGGDGAAEPVSETGAHSNGLPRCAGVGVEDSKAWVCKTCRDALCVGDTVGMPGPALANLMWGGREHPAYQDISEAMRVLLGRGRLVYQKVILTKGAPDEQLSGLAGNCVLLTQPKSSVIIQTLPPPLANLTDGFVVMFTTRRQDVRKAKMLEVPREQYLRCARLRAQVCEVFADSIVSEEAAQKMLPEQGVPEAFVEEALETQEAEHFKPTMVGPASMRNPDAAVEEEVDARQEPEETEAGESESHSKCDHSAAAAERGEILEQNMAENLIGLEEAHVDDPGARFAVLQRKLEMLQKETKKLEDNERRREAAGQAAVELQAGVDGQREHCKQVALDVRDLARKMGAKYELELERAVSVAEGKQHSEGLQAPRENRVDAQELAPQRQLSDLETSGRNASGCAASEPTARPRLTGLQVQTGAALSTFDAQCWPLCFTEFFYGDCAPNLKRPAPLTFKQVFSYLMLREELEYALEDDEEPYRAKAMCRWDKPKFAMVFASVLRSLRLLQSAKMAFGGRKCETTFKRDLGIIANASAADFERARAVLPAEGSVISAFTSPAVRENNTVHTALKHLLMSTATVPLTEGHKMATRHFGFALSNHFGSLKLFYTANFADTYSPITVMLYDGEFCGVALEHARCLGRRSVNLFENAPEMPTLRDMHRIVAAHPTIQARLFIHLERVLMTELLCIQGAFIGFVALDTMNDSGLPGVHSYEDDYASNGEPGLANFATAVLDPLEAQGRGFSHGHKKTMGVPRTAEAKLRQMFEQDDGALRESLQRARDELLRCAATIMYDSATLPADQFGEKVLPEPFSKRQQVQSRLDGGEEIDGSRRTLLEVTAPEPQGHVVRERTLAEAELRACRNTYREVPLSGCQQSALPRYRLPQAFGQIEVPDEQGLWDSAGRTSFSHTEPWIENEKCEITGFRLPDGREASAEEVEQDARNWARAFARDARTCHAQNHDHDCTDTCVKYAAKQGKNAGVPEPGGGEAPKTKATSWTVPPCRFLFYCILVFIIFEGPREVVRRVLRRGKALVSKAYIAVSNEHNEHGSFVPERRQPFRSSSSDVHQVVFRCNGDVQFKDRVVPSDVMPDDSGAAEPATYSGAAEPATSESSGRGGLFFGSRSLSPLKRAVVICYEIALKASSVADYYITKYQSKAQQVLSAAMGPITSGLRRLEAEAQAQAEVEEAPPEGRSLASLARAKLRRMVFSANRSHWFSACELSIFVLTGGHCVQSHRSKEIFLGRAHYLMHECQRVLNGNTSQSGPLQASFVDVVDVVTLAPALPDIPEDGTEDRGAGHPGADADDEGEMDVAVGDGGVEDCAEGDGAAHGAAGDTDRDEAGVGFAGEAEEADDDECRQSRKPLQVFTETTGLRDDWLHRGFVLKDMDLYQYSIVIERIRRPLFLTRRQYAGNVFAFDPHYRLANSYCQQITTWPRTVPRLVGSACPRSDARDGEDYACWMATLFTPLRCPGRGGCADPLQCSTALVEKTMPSKQSSGAKESATHQRTSHSFAVAWRLRRAEIQVLARRGRAKSDAAKRIPVVMDTTLCKRWCPDDVTLVHGLLQRLTIHQLFFTRGRSGTCVERLVDLVLDAWGVPTGHHPHQLHVAEFCACKSVDVIMNIMLGVESRNTAKETAKNERAYTYSPTTMVVLQSLPRRRVRLSSSKMLVVRWSTMRTSRRTLRTRRQAAHGCW